MAFASLKDNTTFGLKDTNTKIVCSIRRAGGNAIVPTPIE